MSDSFSTSHSAPPAARPLRISLNEVPALFSEGPEPEAPDLAKSRCPQAEAANHRAKMAWLSFFCRLMDRLRPFWLRAIRT